MESRTGIIEPCRPWLSWVGLDCLWGVDAFRTECHGATTHPLKGNSGFSEREALLKCTERFGPILVAATRIDAKDLTQCVLVLERVKLDRSITVS